MPVEEGTEDGTTRPTWYAGPETTWGEFWTMLHLPYTGMVLGFVVVGAALAPRVSWVVLGGMLLAYVLGLGIGAHFLDQVPGMGSRYVTHWPTWSLWTVGLAALASALALGLAGAWRFGGVPLVLLVVVQGLCAFGYPLKTWFGGVLHRDSVFAVSWGSLPFLTSYFAQAHGFTVGTLVTAGVFGGVALLEIRLSRASRQLRSQARARPAAKIRFRKLDLALELLSSGTILAALSVLAYRLGFFA